MKGTRNFYLGATIAALVIVLGDRSIWIADDRPGARKRQRESSWRVTKWIACGRSRSQITGCWVPRSVSR